MWMFAEIPGMEFKLSLRLCHSLQLSIADLLSEIHNLHHPLSSSLYYEDQIVEAQLATKIFFETRFAKWFQFFEKPLANQSYLLGETITYVDLSLFQVWSGLLYAYPKRMQALQSKYRKVEAHFLRVKNDQNLMPYLGSERRIPFNEHGIFRHYANLDT